MSSESDPKAVRKLLRVLVAGGVALAGVNATRAAEADKDAASTEAAKKAPQQDKKQEREKAEKAEKDKKQAEAQKKAAKSDSGGGGVKGW